MDQIRLTKNANALLQALYKDYGLHRNNGKSKLDASIFGGSEAISKEILPKWNIEDITETCWELDSVGFLECIPGDDTVQIAILTDAGIEWMEGRFKRGLSTLWNGIKDLLSFIPTGV